jgi:hypothetical protein
VARVKRPAIIIAKELFSLLVVDCILLDVFGESEDGMVSYYYIA